ncbi:CD63 antigen [Myripristis murdjan]|uniref:Tetraspanin n=1 Tax=Myripristis murdjan TaxID=586833 RepID=A0A667YBB0_9TELE|nr:CD63 antigen [Myripristis murdjan]XP_029911702.1 CD63 antigen [Myripristis murdjan]
MGVEGGMKCVKFLLFFFNFIFWICGLALIVVGVLVQMALHSTFMIKDASASAIPLVLIIVGVVIFFIAFFGCCGAWKENYCMITMFSILLSLIIIVEIAAAIAGYIYRGKLTVIVQDSFTDMINQYNSNSTDEFRNAVDKMQEDLKCCGVNSSSDWKNFRPGGNSVPDSCCINVTAGCGVGAMTDSNKVYQQGCQIALETKLRQNIQWVIVAALVIAFLQIMGIVFACLLMRGIRSGYEVM